MDVAKPLEEFGIIIDRFLKQLAQRGLGIKWNGEGLVITGPAAEKTPEVIAAAKAFKRQLMERFRPEGAGVPHLNDTLCLKCKRIVSALGQECGCAEVLDCPYKERR